jgi:hypothetical protein
VWGRSRGSAKAPNDGRGFVRAFAVGKSRIGSEKEQLTIKIADFDNVSVGYYPLPGNAEETEPIVEGTADRAGTNLKDPANIDRPYKGRPLR